jgi:hypothetical protein
MADGELAAVFKALAKDAAEAAGKITESVAKLSEQTADIEESNVAKLLDLDAKSAEDIASVGKSEAVSGSKYDPRYLSRQDEDFSAQTNPSGLRKSRYDPDEGMVPANPDGDATPTQHVLGGHNPAAKENSPYTSFAPEGGDGKIYGPQEMRLDYKQLQADIANGKVSGVQVLSPDEVQGSIQNDIDRIAGRHVDVNLPSGATPDQVKDFVSAEGLSNNQARQLQSRIRALLNTQRDGEWLVKGIIPPEYLSGPFPTGNP